MNATASLSGKRVLVVEDNATTADTVRLFLEGAGATVALEADGAAGLARFEKEAADAVVLDVMMPGLDGVSVCRRIRETSHAPIVLLTALTDPQDVVEGLEAGADDYIRKPFDPGELVARIKTALRRADSLRTGEDGRIRAGPFVLDVSASVVETNGRREELTRTEMSLLRTLMSAPERVFTRDQLIDAARGSDADMFDRTIDVHISNLRKKLGEPKRDPRHILTEVGVGYRFRP